MVVNSPGGLALVLWQRYIYCDASIILGGIATSMYKEMYEVRVLSPQYDVDALRIPPPPTLS